MNDKKINKKPWPTKAAMQQVYELGLWGTGDGGFYSGSGSHDATIVQPYLNTVRTFLTSFHGAISVADLGCGDFNIGRNLVSLCSAYTATDIVPELIKYNQAKFVQPNLQFSCIDIAKDELPVADCAIVRQVLQHLCNDEVLAVTKKLARYKYLIITEHLPDGTFEANKNIISGQGIRLKKNSGVDLIKPPFNFKPQSIQELLRINSPEFKGVIVTTLFQM